MISMSMIRYLAFQMSEVFPEDDPLSEWLITLALAMNDLALVHVRLDEDPEEPDRRSTGTDSPSHTSRRRHCFSATPRMSQRSGRWSSHSAMRRERSTTSASPSFTNTAASCSARATRPRSTIPRSGRPTHRPTGPYGGNNLCARGRRARCRSRVRGAGRGGNQAHHRDDPCDRRGRVAPIAQRSAREGACRSSASLRMSGAAGRGAGLDARGGRGKPMARDESRRRLSSRGGERRLIPKRSRRLPGSGGRRSASRPILSLRLW
jgi:hypothetical protein